MKRLITLVALVLLLAACRGAGPAAGADPPPGGTSVHTLTVGGRNRAYRLHRPPGASGPLPLVVFLHGGFGDGAQAESAYGWDALADREQALVAYPDGVQRAWNVGDGCCGRPGAEGVDDVAFVEAVVADVRGANPVDAARIYATGISNGGMLAYRLACDSTVFAAIGPDSATMLGPCPGPSPVSVIHLHGTADRNIRLDGAPGSGVAAIDGPPVGDVIAAWRRTDRCAAAISATRGSVTTSTAVCPGGRAVELITIEGAGHQWPGSTRTVAQRALHLDPPSTALDATTVIWDFFTAHPARNP